MFALDEVLCLDLNGMADGNQGYQDELEFIMMRGFEVPKDQEAPTEAPAWAADILWRHSLKPYRLSYQDATSCSMIDVDGYYSSTHRPEGYEIDLPEEGRRHTGPGRMVCLEIGPLPRRPRQPGNVRRAHPAFRHLRHEAFPLARI